MEKLVKQITGKRILRRPTKLPKNLILKLVSLFFAVFLWYFVVGEDKVDVILTVPIEITNLSQNLVISNQFRKQLDVTVNGPRGLVRSIQGQHITRPVDLSDVQPGNHVIKNNPESIKLPKGVQIQNIRPANITLTIDRLIEKELPIKAVIRGNPAPGYEVEAITANPSTLDLTAPAAILQDIVFLPTEPIDLSGRKSSFDRQVALNVKDEITELIGEPTITVKIVFKEKLTSREFYNIPVEFEHEAKRTIYRLHPTHIDIKTEMPFDLAETEASEFQFKAVIEAGNLPPGEHELPVKIISAQPKIIIKQVLPPTVKIDISRSQPALKKNSTSSNNGSNRR